MCGSAEQYVEHIAFIVINCTLFINPEEACILTMVYP
jgi:hypothetical protein